jgi:hypothetical protein
MLKSGCVLLWIYFINCFYRHCEVRSNLYVGKAFNLLSRSVKYIDCFVPRNDAYLA